MSTDIITTLVISLFGCTGFWELLREVRARRRQSLRKDELAGALEDALGKSETITRMQETLADNNLRITQIDQWRQTHEEENRRVQLVELRETMMHDPISKLGHEHQLLAGEEYLKSGGNGVGRIRYEQLKAEYEERSQHRDWIYTGRKE